MGRLWIALALLLAVGTNAEANVACCKCPSEVVLPERNAKDVPLNTKIWHLGGKAFDHDYKLVGHGPIEAFAGRRGAAAITTFTPKTLAPHEQYWFDGVDASTTFTTGTVIDHDPPRAPQVLSADVTVMPQPSERMQVATFAVDSSYDDQTALVRVELTDKLGTVSFLMTPRATFLCLLGVSAAPGRATVSVRAIDLAGNESPAVSVETEIGITADATPDLCSKPIECSERPRGESDLVPPTRGCGTGATAMFIFGITVVGGFVIGIITIVMLRRYRRRDDDPATPISLLVAEHAARATRTRTGIFGGLGLFGLLALIGAGVPVFPIVFAIWTLPALRGFWIATSALRLIESAGASAEATTSSITVRSGKRHARVNLTPSELTAARKRGVPAASSR